MSKLLRLIFTVVAAVAIAMGLLWIAQGMGWVRWPADSFMLGQPQWSWRGAGLVLLGVFLLWRVRRGR